jgi:hypothetical protein
MQPHEADPTSPTPPPPPAPAPAPEAAGRSARRPEVIRTWLMTLAAALLAGIASWLVGERTYDYFRPSEGAGADLFRFAALNRETSIAQARNGAVTFGALGALLGLGLGLAGGLSRRSPAGALVGGAVGLVLAGAAGALPAFAVMPWQWMHRNDDPATLDLMMPLLIHGGLWCALGAAAGLAFAVGRVGLKPIPLLEGALGGLVGAAFGTVVFELVGGFAFPLAHTAYPFSANPGTRLLARLCVTLFAAAGTLLMFRPRLDPGRKVVAPVPDLA